MPTAKSIVTAGSLRNISMFHPTPQFIANQVFPELRATDPTMKITKHLLSDWYRDDAGVRGEGAQARRGGHKATDVTYSCFEYAFASEVTDEIRRNAKKQTAMPLQPDVEALELCKTKIRLKREKDVVALIKASTWADGNSGGEDAAAGWASATTTNTFKSDIVAGLQTLEAKGIISGGNMEIRLVLDALTFDEVVEITAIKNQIIYTSAESITPDMLAKILKIDKVIVARPVECTDEETKAGAENTTSRIWHSNTTKGIAMLYGYPKKLGLKVLTPGLIVNQKFDAEAGGGYERISKWRESANHQDVYEVAEIRDQVQVIAECAYLWVDTIVT